MLFDIDPTMGPAWFILDVLQKIFVIIMIMLAIGEALEYFTKKITKAYYRTKPELNVIYKDPVPVRLIIDEESREFGRSIF